jgi:sulfatase maturation enzyme AslB (radical SAM superfamily)
MCGPSLSSSWNAEDLKRQGKNEKAVIHVNDNSKMGIMRYVDMFIDEVKEIYFAGGEPLQMSEHYEILEKLIASNNKRCVVRYNTNLSHLRFSRWDVVDLWQQLDHVSVFASIDDFGLRAEYARKGTRWNDVEKNIKRLLDSNINFHTSSTINIFNYLHISEIVDKLISMGIPYYYIHFNNILTNPIYYNINILPQNLIDEGIKRLTSHLKLMNDQAMHDHFLREYEGIFNFTNDRTFDKLSHQKRFKVVTEILDKRRNESFETIFPELSEWYKKI